MGTRAAFWIGDPRKLDERRLIGCKHWDGYPSEFEFLASVTSAEDFESKVRDMASRLDDWCPAERGWPYPWADDIFLTDFTYAYFDGAVHMTCYHCGFRPYAIEWSDEEDERPDDPSLKNVPAPGKWNGDRGGIIIVSAPA